MWRASIALYDTEIEKIKPAAGGKTYGGTEGIFDYMAEALGLKNETPWATRSRRQPVGSCSR